MAAGGSLGEGMRNFPGGGRGEKKGAGGGVIVLDVPAPPGRGQTGAPTAAPGAGKIEIAPPLPVDPEMERLLQ